MLHFSYKHKINQVKVKANKGGILSLLFTFLMRIIKGKWGQPNHMISHGNISIPRVNCDIKKKSMTGNGERGTRKMWFSWYNKANTHDLNVVDFTAR